MLGPLRGKCKGNSHVFHRCSIRAKAGRPFGCLLAAWTHAGVSVILNIHFLSRPDHVQSQSQHCIPTLLQTVFATMGTRGYQAWRFRKRYYVKYNNHDSHPSGLGTWIARSIPLNPKDYATWLESQRRMIREWEAEFLEALMPTQKELDDKPCVDGMEDPSWFPPMNGSMIKWVYVLDLDREIFSIDNSVHLKLERVPHVNLVDALADGILGGRDEFRIFALGYIPEAAVANPMDEPPVVNPRMVLDDYGNELAPKVCCWVRSLNAPCHY